MHLGAYDEHSLGIGLIGAVLRNLYPLFPFGYGVIAAPVTPAMIVFFVFLPVYRGKVGLKKQINWSRIGLYGLLGLIVYIRFLVLWQHSWKHYFFTYRVQAASILALCFIILELVEPVPTHRKAVKTHGSDNPHALSE